MSGDWDLEFSPHALDQMHAREIPEQAVRQILGDADEVLERFDGRTEYTGVWEGRTIMVVIEGDEEPLVVVTVIELKRRRR